MGGGGLVRGMVSRGVVVAREEVLVMGAGRGRVSHWGGGWSEREGGLVMGGGKG